MNTEKPSFKENIPFFLLILLSVWILLALPVGIVFLTEKMDQQQKIALEEQVSIQLQKKIILQRFDTITADLKFLCKQNELQHYLESGDNSYLSELENEYVNLSINRKVYDQIRFISEKGKEIIRVDYYSGTASALPQEKLQYKGDRYYFLDTIILPEGTIFVSPFDLNIEHGELEIPYKPMIRFSAPVFDNAGRERGIVIINYLGDDLINSLRQSSTISPGEIFLVNPEAYWMCSSNPEEEWGFMIEERADFRFDFRYPEEWKIITGNQEKQIRTKAGLFTFATIYPLEQGMRTSTGSSEAYAKSAYMRTAEEYFWKVISFYSRENFREKLSSIKYHLLKILLIFYGISILPAWFLTRYIIIRNRRKAHLWYSANFDILTGVPNRSLFEDRLKQTVQQSARYSGRFALFFLDLDGFKQINDVYGHDAGDELLKQVSIRITELLRTSDTFARQGGDEFTLILPRLINKNEAEIVAEKILAAFQEPFILNKAEVTVSGSIGIALFPDNGEGVKILMEKADQAMYCAKKAGKNTFCFSSEE